MWSQLRKSKKSEGTPSVSGEERDDASFLKFANSWGALDAATANNAAADESKISAQLAKDRDHEYNKKNKAATVSVLGGPMDRFRLKHPIERTSSGTELDNAKRREEIRSGVSRQLGALPTPPTPTIRDDDDDVWYSRDHPGMWALTYEQLLAVDELAQKTFGSWSYRSKTMRHVNEAIIIPRCQKFETSYALSWNPKGQRIDAFITHCWDEPFADFVESIRNAFHPFTDKPNVWICAFALPQGNYQLLQEQSKVPMEESPFVRALRRATWFVVVRNSQVDLYSRAWCVAELYFAHQFGFTMNKRNSKTLVIGPDNFSHLRTSCVNAQASDPRDKYKIIRALLQDQGNLKAIDELVLQYRKHGTQRTNTPSVTTRDYFLWIFLLGIVLASIWLVYGVVSYKGEPRRLPIIGNQF
jgi:hypothetical protein